LITLPEGLFYTEANGMDKYVQTRDARFNAVLNEIKEGVEFEDTVIDIFNKHGLSVTDLAPAEIDRFHRVTGLNLYSNV